MADFQFKLGKKPARPGAIQFKFADIFKANDLPPLPTGAFGRYATMPAYGLLGNDRWGDCFWAGSAVETMFARWLINVPCRITTADVLDDYAAATGFNSANPISDQGTELDEGAKYRRTTGIRDANNVRHFIDAYVDLLTGNVHEVQLATFLMDAAGIGIQLPRSAMDQFMTGQPWDVVPNDGGIEGGHYVPCLGRNAQGQTCVRTWNKIQPVTDAFLQKYMDEGVGYIYLDALDAKGLSAQGYDKARLEAMLNEVDSV